ncbi:hypothetical protein QQ045_031423 [Rhodiola kirilowii]
MVADTFLPFISCLSKVPLGILFIIILVLLHLFFLFTFFWYLSYQDFILCISKCSTKRRSKRGKSTLVKKKKLERLSGNSPPALGLEIDERCSHTSRSDAFKNMNII